MTHVSNKRILDVVKVGFDGRTGDNRAPESFPFPSCMTSLMQYLGEDYLAVEIEAHNRKYTLRTGNVDFITASGMAFGLLWHKEFCPSCMDLMQVNEHDATIAYAFDWAGYEYEVVEKARDCSNRDQIKDMIVESIDNGIPVLAFGIIGPPECLIITGYDDGGDTVTGWSHFQEWEPCDKEPNGMFRKAGWYDNLWKVIITGRKMGRKTDLRNILKLGLSVMKKTESQGYVAGLAAYDEWIKYVLDPELDNNADDETLKARHEFHNLLVGNLAEARYWGGSFMARAGQQMKDENIKSAAQCFNEIHDLCWKVWGVLGEFGEKDVWKKYRIPENRRRIASLLGSIKGLDEKAMEHLRRSVGD